MGRKVAEEAYGVLIQWLRANHLDWVADQVEDEITLGKVRSQRISIATDGLFEHVASIPGESQAPRRTTAEFVGRADYSAEEKFEMVAAAIQAVVVGGVKIQDALAKALGADGPNAEIHFVPGETDEISHSYRPREVDPHRSSAAEVERLFADLREDVQNAD